MGWLPAVISGGVDLLSQGISAAVNANQSKKQRQWQEQMYARQLSDTRQMRDESWARQDQLLKDEREYNSPVNQVALAKEAGLNPALINGGQMTSALTSISGAGNSPDAPSPGSYSYTPIQPTNIGSRAVGNYLQAQSLEIAQQNADSARINAITERNKSISEITKNIAQGKNFDAQTQSFLYDIIYKDLTLNERVAMVGEELQGLQLDNALKDFDLTHMRPAALDKMNTEISYLEGELSKIPYQIELLSSQSYDELTSAQVNNELVRFYQKQVDKIDLENMYLSVITDIAKQKLPQEEFRTAVQAWDFWIDKGARVVDSVSMFISSLSSLSRARAAGRLGSRAYKAAKGSKEIGPAIGKLEQTFNETIDFNKRYDDKKRQQDIEWWQKTWDSLDPLIKEDISSSENFQKTIMPYLKNK